MARRKHRHDWTPKVYEEPRDIPRDGTRVFVCECGAETVVGGALANPNDARDDSYRPDLPLRSTDANVAKWADEIGGSR